MSYILDALKKSEREKTLGQVPTLESVVADGAKKQPSGTPWWLNVVVFFVTLVVVFGILSMAGLIDFSKFKDSISGQPAQDSQSQQSTAATNETDTETAGSATTPQVAQDNAAQIQTLSANDVQEVDIPSTQIEPEINTPAAQVNEDLQLAEATQNDEAGLNELAVETSESEPENAIQPEPSPVLPESQELAALAEEETAVQNQTVDANMGNEQNTVQPQASIEQQPEKKYEEALHQNLRDISVNMVSFSNDALQRFVMLDLTIYKEGDNLPNNAQVVEIIRTGAIVEFENKRYLLKP